MITSALCSVVGNGDLNLDARLDGDGGNLLHSGGWADEIDQTLVNAELVAIPCLGTLTARSHAGSLGGQTDGALDGKVLVLGTLEKLGDNCNNEDEFSLKSTAYRAGRGSECSTGQIVFLA